MGSVGISSRSPVFAPVLALYDERARMLAQLFRNEARFFSKHLGRDVQVCVINACDLVISGPHLVVDDPLLCSAPSPLAKVVPSGTYPLLLSIVDFPGTVLKKGWSCCRKI